MIFKWRKNAQNQTETKPPAVPSHTSDTATDKESWLTRLRHGLKKTRTRLTTGLTHLLQGQKKMDDALFEEIETHLLSADVGVPTTTFIMDALVHTCTRNTLQDNTTLLDALKQQLITILTAPLALPPFPSPDSATAPHVILIVGVNGVGKTTTIGKLAHFFQLQQHRVYLAAGDTFRAAAIAQLQAWGTRTNSPVIATEQGADSAAVIFDAYRSACQHNASLLIADTAGRLHTKRNLIDELKKIKRVLQKTTPSPTIETLLVIDGTMGQNTLRQATVFQESIGLDGLIVTKLDGTAKGGAVFAMAHTLKLPICFIGVGEKVDDLRPFSATEFVEALFTGKEEDESAHST